MKEMRKQGNLRSLERIQSHVLVISGFMAIAAAWAVLSCLGNWARVKLMWGTHRGEIGMPLRRVTEASEGSGGVWVWKDMKLRVYTEVSCKTLDGLMASEKR